MPPGGPGAPPAFTPPTPTPAPGPQAQAYPNQAYPSPIQTAGYRPAYYPTYAPNYYPAPSYGYGYPSYPMYPPMPAPSYWYGGR